VGNSRRVGLLRDDPEPSLAVVFRSSSCRGAKGSYCPGGVEDVNVRNGWKADIDCPWCHGSNQGMREELISKITLDDTGRLLLKPSETAFDDLHMAGAWGFRWDAPTGSLAIPIPREWSYCDWFGHVVTIIGREYGVHLKVGPHTEWTSVPSSVQAEIEASNV